MLDHAFVHSCFGIHSSCALRISSFPTARIPHPHSSLIVHPSSFPHSSGLTRDRSGRKRHPTGLIGD